MLQFTIWTGNEAVRLPMEIFFRVKFGFPLFFFCIQFISFRRFLYSVFLYDRALEKQKNWSIVDISTTCSPSVEKNSLYERQCHTVLLPSEFIF